MAMQIQRVMLGVDVSQGWLDIHRDGEETVERIANERRAIDTFLKRFPGAAVAVEATNIYHELVVERALRLGLVVYLVSGYQIKHYGNALGQRMRTDEIDARLISRFLSREIDRLRPYQPKSPQHALLWKLLKRRATVVQVRQRLQQSLSGIELGRETKLLGNRFARVLAELDRRIAALVKSLGWQAEVSRIQRISGVGPLTAQALVVAYHSGTFIHHDPFIAYLGLDVRAKDSGTFRGQRKLSKRGDGEYRRLLYCAALAACRMPGYFRERLHALMARGLSSTAAHVVVARKLATIAFHLLRKEVDFDPARLAPGATS